MSESSVSLHMYSITLKSAAIGYATPYSKAGISSRSNLLQTYIMEVKEVRKKNAQLLIASRSGGIQADFARTAGVAVGYLNQILNDWQDRSMGASVARRIEKRVGKPRGWMDIPHTDEWLEAEKSVATHSGGRQVISTRTVLIAEELETLSDVSLDAVANLIDALKRIEGQAKPPPSPPQSLHVRK